MGTLHMGAGWSWEFWDRRTFQDPTFSCSMRSSGVGGTGGAGGPSDGTASASGLGAAGAGAAACSLSRSKIFCLAGLAVFFGGPESLDVQIFGEILMDEGNGIRNWIEIGSGSIDI